MTKRRAYRSRAASIASLPQWDGQLERKLPLTAAIICQNEQDRIGKCLMSLADCAEIIVVDSGSTDNTLAIIQDFIARGFPIKLLQQAWLGYARQKQFALDQASQPWILSIDADEWIDATLRADLPNLIAADESVAGFKLRRALALHGRDAPVITHPERILRLVRKGRAHFDQELLVHEGLIADGAVRIAAKGVLRHECGLRLDEQITKDIAYARLKAQQRIERGERPSLLKLLFNPWLYFFRTYVLHGLFLWGRPGFIHAKTRATYSFLGEALHFQLWAEQERQGASDRARVDFSKAPAAKRKDVE